MLTLLLAAFARAADPVDLDLERLSTGHLAVWVDVGGDAPRRFLLDTGAGVLAVTPEAAEALGVPTEGGVEVLAGTATGTLPIRLVRLGDTVIAGVDLRGARAAVLDLGPVIAALDTSGHPDADGVREELGSLDGVLGRGFFERADVEVDLGAGTASAWPRRAAPVDGAVRVPFRLYKGMLATRGRVEDVPVRIVLDLGANGGTAGTGLFALGTPTGAAGLMWGAEGEAVSVVQARFDAVSIGGLALGARELSVCPPETAGVACPSGRRVLLGFDALEGRRFVLSYARRALWVW